MVAVQDCSPSFEYELEALPPGRVGFRRWRWKLWKGASLVASGWRVAPADAERALQAAAARLAHELLGVHALRLERARARDRFIPGASVTVDCGAVTCVLAPRQESAGESRSAAA